LNWDPLSFFLGLWGYFFWQKVDFVFFVISLEPFFFLCKQCPLYDSFFCFWQIGKKNSKDLRMKVYTRKIIILVHTYRKNCTHKNLVCILDYGWWGVFTEFCSDSTAVCLYLVDESKTTTTNPDETSFLLIFYICSRLLKEFFDMEE